MTVVTNTSDHRSDIDGLRGVAVLSVIVFHIHSALIPGGFVGVDIFFVISGFVITRNLFQSLEQGRFSIGEFYKRRIRRIAPAMIVVVLVTLVVAQLIMLPEDARKTAKSAVASLASLANVYFWYFQDTSYFADSSLTIPLLHLWSLGVEEQFYLFFPWFLLLTYRWSSKNFFLSILIIIIFSFFIGDLFFGKDASFVYYMLPSRAGELLLGSLAAHVTMGKVFSDASKPYVATIEILGALLILGSFVFLSEHQQFPGWRALPATLGTAALLVAGHYSGSKLSNLLSKKILVWVGSISYSAYLWHWPLLAFYRYGFGELGFFSGFVIFLLTLLLAWLSYRYVEQPARKTQLSVLKTTVYQYGVPAGVVGIFALGFSYADKLGLPLNSDNYLAQLSDIRGQTRPAYEFDFVCQRMLLSKDDLESPQCVVGAKAVDARTAILWGDSNAAHYIGMLSVFAKEQNFRFRNVEIGSCPPIYSDPESFVDANRVDDCRKSLALVRSVLDKYSVVIIAASWTSYDEKSEEFLQATFDTVSALAKKGKLVILIGKAPIITGYDRVCREKSLKFPLLDCPQIKVELDRKVVEINERLRRFAEKTSNVNYFDANSYLCPSGICSSFDSEMEPIYYDSSHLTLKYSEKLGSKIIESEGVPKPFSLITKWRNASTDR